MQDKLARTPRLVRLHDADSPDRSAAVRAELQAGLVAESASIAPKYFYDTLGSRLFDAITELPEYYPTRTEAAIFADHGVQMAGAAGTGRTLIDLGAGSCEKAAALFERLQPRRYVAVDISVEYLGQTLQCLQRRFPALEMVGVGLDFSAALELPADLLDGPALFFYPGSSIGNFTPGEALRFVRRVHDAGGADAALLIGVDLVKPRAVLQTAYDDALGVSAAFNLNLLRHVNRLLGSDFDVADWRHVALWNDAASRIEMHLEARRSLSLRWPGGERRFAAVERIHTENSYKYHPEDFAGLLRDAGFADVRHWEDERGWFSVMLATA